MPLARAGSVRRERTRLMPPPFSRRDLLRLAGAAGAASLGGIAAPADSDTLFPFGAIHMSTISHWQHYLPPVKEWAAYIEKDILNMKAVRFNTLVAHVDWYDIEPAPGRMDFERLDRLMDLVE
jgi:hypothetical protein